MFVPCILDVVEITNTMHLLYHSFILYVGHTESHEHWNGAAFHCSRSSPTPVAPSHQSAHRADWLPISPSAYSYTCALITVLAKTYCTLLS
jgi:hypothetical protein